MDKTPVKNIDEVVEHIEEFSDFIVERINGISDRKIKYGDILPWEKSYLQMLITQQKTLNNIYCFIFDLPIKLQAPKKEK